MRFVLPLLVCCAAGCGTEPPAAASVPAPNEPAKPSAFAPSECGTVTGVVSWSAPVPHVPTATRNVFRSIGSGVEMFPVRLARAPHIDPASRGFGGVVVSLRGVDPARAKPWDHESASVSLEGEQLVVKQGARTGRTAFVRRGEQVSFVSRESDFRAVRLRGASFGSLPFPDAEKPLARAFDAHGLVELSSASGHYWQSAEVFVCDHPYYAVSAPDGRFTFTNVPAGEYALAAWHPNWNVERVERYPETGLPWRNEYAAPLESTRRVMVAPGRGVLANVALPK
jgi:Polysaccharide lyase family 4, domain II